MKSEDGAVQRGILKYDTAARVDSCWRISLGGTSLTHAHVIGPLRLYGRQEVPNQVLTIHPDREKKVHPFIRRVKLAALIQMRH